MRLVALATACVAVLCTLAGAAVAGDYPDKKIELVVAFNPGGGSDTFGRAVARFGEKYVGQPIFVTNRAGGAGAIGFVYGAKAKPDGYTLTLAVTTLTIAPYMTKGYPVTYKDYAPLALLAVVPSCISVSAESKYKTLQDFLKDAKAQPGKMRVGTSGTGSPWHLAGAALGNAAKVNFSFVPYKGAGPTITALMGGHIDSAITSAAEIFPHVQAGKVRVLAIIADKRFPVLPDVPTTIELGLKANVVAWRGLVAPNKTPKDRVTYLIKAITKLSEDKEFLDFMAKNGVTPHLITGEKFGQWLKVQSEDYANLVKLTGLVK
ncbi:ABC transporter substrate-binding protein [Desulfoferula mesophila]|uniref:ABC transporter substrate-binding protein n=1 Tax=Desulfoferula mesophila TaxID=3058419 RepID=A0AAU9EIQ8_9BACT|nr:ABC transporter substrate-binding protein [Desulfoferula mesophilus]